jgi:hypothetical protein
MKVWSWWLPDILPHVPGCPIPVAEHELKRAAQVFFATSRAWLVTEPEVAGLAGDVELSIVPTDPEQDLVRLEQAWINGIPATVKTVAEMDSQASDWQTHEGTPSIVVQLSPDVARLYPIPLADFTVKWRASIIPSDVATGLPDDMAATYRDELAQGAKGRLMLYPNKSWTALDIAGVVGGAFADGASKANLEAARSFGKGRIKARPKWC